MLISLFQTLQHTISLGVTGDRTLMGSAGIDIRVFGFGVGWIIFYCRLLDTLFASCGNKYFVDIPGLFEIDSSKTRLSLGPG